MRKAFRTKFSLALIITVLTSASLFAQPGQGRGQGRGAQMTEEDVRERVERLADTLNMTEKQEKEILESELEFFKTIQKERENFDPETGDREAMRAKMMELRDEREAKYKAVLTEEQYILYRKIADQRREEMQQRRGGQGSQSERGRGRGRGG